MDAGRQARQEQPRACHTAVAAGGAPIAELAAHSRRQEICVHHFRRQTVDGFSRAKNQIDAAMLAEARKGDPEATEIPHWTFHDLRRTTASHMASLRVQPHVIEAVLNHASGTIKGVARIYNRHTYGAKSAPR